MADTTKDEFASLREFYGVDSDAEMIRTMLRQIERLQERLHKLEPTIPPRQWQRGA